MEAPAEYFVLALFNSSTFLSTSFWSIKSLLTSSVEGCHMTFFSETPVPWISPALIAHTNVNLVEMLMRELPGASKYILYWIMGKLSKW